MHRAIPGAIGGGGMRLIGKGAQADIFLNDGCAYKVYTQTEELREALFEALLTQTARDAGLNAPGIFEVKRLGGKPCVVMEFIRGETLHGILSRDPAKLTEMVGLLVDEQLMLHRADGTNFLPLRDKLEDGLARARIDGALRESLRSRLLGLPDGTAVCHGDFHFLNLMRVPGGGIRVVDWVDVRRGPALADAARSYVLLASWGREVAERYFAVYRERSGALASEIHSWIPIAAAARLCENVDARQRTLLEELIRN